MFTVFKLLTYLTHFVRLDGSGLFSLRSSLLSNTINGLGCTDTLSLYFTLYLSVTSLMGDIHKYVMADNFVKNVY